MTPTNFATGHSSAINPFSRNINVDEARKANDLRLKSCFESICEKYGKDFRNVGDEIDLETGQIVVDNGHLHQMEAEDDVGMLGCDKFHSAKHLGTDVKTPATVTGSRTTLQTVHQRADLDLKDTFENRSCSIENAHFLQLLDFQPSNHYHPMLDYLPNQPCPKHYMLGAKVRKANAATQFDADGNSDSDDPLQDNYLQTSMTSRSFTPFLLAHSHHFAMIRKIRPYYLTKRIGDPSASSALY
ncbi:predicted protein [Uncinocarpus reesii 1704]|uniref:Uncharacterized protein n=1 Tax=Uncinocarpus reesii (strain UAMH 1704) TaxID=336963 RepID=C4JIL3_UNCRE|nr:uncharacterized protein UREG_01550 [Uncinocarpus reesii 1704]EEP76701.1 predicted protein [Uncinocarpus reesii 1704]